MESLPVEILEQVFKSLHQEDKVECMLVCRSWEDIIKNTVLFNTIRLHSKYQLDKLVGNIRLEPHNGDRVERLIIEVDDVLSSDINFLPFLFSNLCEITLYDEIYDELYNSNKRLKKVQSFYSWKKSIRIIRNKFGYILIKLILKGGICPLLTEIQMNGVHRDSSNSLIKLLGNAPNLKVLSLWNYSFTLMDLEVLHNNVPLLESLSFTYCQINSDIFPVDIKPAQYMKKLYLTGVSHKTNEMFINSEKYMAKKYPRIVHLSLTFYISIDSNKEACIKSGVALRIQQIGSYLTSLTYMNNDNSFQFFFPILDQNECKIKRMIIGKKMEDSDFLQITESKQAQYIQALSCRLDSISIITKNFHKLAALTELKLSFHPYNTTVDLNKLMDEIGKNLEILELSSAQLLFDRSLILSCPKLKKLELKKIELPPDSDFFISRSFPNLCDLVIHYCTWSSSKFCMENSSLYYLEIRMPIPSEYSYILVITTSNNKKRWYTTNKVSEMNSNPTSDPIISPAVKSLPFDKYNGEPYKTFICKSLNTFFFGELSFLVYILCTLLLL